MNDRLFPETGLTPEDVKQALLAAKAGDIDWRTGRTPMYVFYAGEEAYGVTKDAFNLYFTETALAAKAYPSLRRFESEVVRMAAEILGGNDDTTGSMSSGGTESIFLAVKTARDHARAERKLQGRPALVMAETAHPAFDKAAHYMDLDVIRVKMRGDYRADVDALAKAIDARTLMLVGSAPCFPFGVVDPITEIARLAAARGVWMHVDACVGGFLAPFVKKLGHPMPDFDLSVPGVWSLSADLHKLGFSAKPASVILYRDAALHRHQGFRFEDWPRGLYEVPTFTGTRPGGAIAAAWATLKHLGTSGYTDIARRIMSVRQRLQTGITAIPGLKLIGDPELCIFSYGADGLDVAAIADGLTDKGWLVGRNARPPAIHVMLTPVHEAMVEDYLRDLREVAERVRSGALTTRGVAATY